jgi:TP901 family phage tail tape measure protein
MDQLRNKALQLGKDTSFSASEAASAIEELVKQGISVPDVMNGAADATVALAEAGELELPRAAEIASNAMNQFKLSAQDLPHVADLLAGAANASSASVGDLGSALEYVGPVAHSMGLSIDDTTGALAILANNGIKGTEAGTQLRGMLLGLTPTTNKQSEAFKKLGLIT